MQQQFRCRQVSLRCEKENAVHVVPRLRYTSPILHRWSQSPCVVLRHRTNLAKTNIELGAVLARRRTVMHCQRIADSCLCGFVAHRRSRKSDASHFLAVRTAIIFSLVSAFALLANSASAQSYNEIASTWFLNPVTSNWTCSIAPGLPPTVQCRTS